MKILFRVPLLILFLPASMAPAQAVATITTLAVTAGGVSVSAVAPGTVITLTATVTAGGAAVTPGQVNFCDATAKACSDVHLLGTQQLTSSGTAVLKFVPGGGIHSYNAVFLGTNGDAQSSSAAASLTVNGSYPTTTTIAQSGGPGDYTLTATVTGSNTTPPSGVVSFLDTTNANYPLATTNLNLGGGTSALSFINSYTLFGPSYSRSGFPPGVDDDDFAQAYIGDFNGDGKLDLAVRWQYYSVRDSEYDAWVQELDILLGNGNGTFTAAPTAIPLSEGLRFFDVVTGDFNNDGKEDLAVLLANDSVLVLLGNGDGTFKTLPPIPVPIGTESIVTGDFNRDGNLDLVLTIYTYEDIKPVDEAHVWVYITTLLGDGDGTFQSPLPAPSQQIYANVQGNPSPPAIGDFNRDGILDLALMNINTKELDVFTGKGDGTFQSTPIVSPVGINNTANVLVGDFNQDGILDLAEETYGTILLGNGDGTFTPEANPGTINDGGDMVIGDFNGDGIADLADITFPGAVVQLGNGDGTFSPTVSVTAASDLLALTLAAGDFNGDGMSDLALGVYGLSPTSDTGFPGPPELTVELAQLAGSATATATVNGISPVGTGTHWVDASYQGDSSYLGSVSATTPLIAEPITTTLSLTANLSGAGEQFLLTATLNPLQAQNHTASGMVTFYNNGVSLGQATVTNGVATLTTILPLGIDSITAMYPGDTNFTHLNQTRCLSTLTSASQPQRIHPTSIRGNLQLTRCPSRRPLTSICRLPSVARCYRQILPAAFLPLPSLGAAVARHS